ncbi:hypothetical protein [Streptomyces sp. NPDC008150]|uniref:hypothetical protein n=1 Tax=Streptomyces sp. NPDC008150 TaxID=3364816 RepID=UPI0036F01421
MSGGDPWWGASGSQRPPDPDSDRWNQVSRPRTRRSDSGSDESCCSCFSCGGCLFIVVMLGIMAVSSAQVPHIPLLSDLYAWLDGLRGS